MMVYKACFDWIAAINISTVDRKSNHSFSVLSDLNLGWLCGN